jgi:hypothetical protein
MANWAKWDGYGKWETEGFISYGAVGAKGCVFQISSLNSAVMVFAIDYYNDETELIGFKDIDSAREWIDWVVSRNEGDYI